MSCEKQETYCNSFNEGIMKYIISFNDLTETKEFNLFEGFNDNSYNKRSDKIKVGRGKFKLTKWETGHINAIRMQYLSHQPIQIIRDIQGEVICLHFMCKGGINLNKIKPLIQKPFQHINNTNNLSFMKNNKTVFKVEKDEEIESFDIFITPEFLKLLSIKHPVLFKKLYEKIKKGTPFKLCRSYMTTTFDMQQAIKWINRSIMCRPFRSKVCH